MRLLRLNMYLQRRRRSTCRSHPCGVGWIARIPEDGNARHLGNRRLEQFQLFSDDLKTDDRGQSRDVSSGARKAGDESAFDWFSRSGYDDGDGRSGLLGGDRVLVSWHDDDVNLAADQLGCEIRETFISTLGNPPLQSNVLTLHIAEVS